MKKHVAEMLPEAGSPDWMQVIAHGDASEKKKRCR